MDVSSLIIDDRENRIFRVHRSAMTSPEIKALEMERVFGKSWLYLGHESELEQPGEYRQRTVAGAPLIFVRGADNVIRAFHNTCPHRGAIVCRQEQGVTDVFQCFYHAWSFNNQGELVGLPDEEGYAGRFDRSERSLCPVARLENYRGFYFVSFNPQIESLVDYLAGAREFLDMVADQSLSGRMKIVSGIQNYSIRANWKLLVENSIDGYHAPPLHQTYMNYLAGVGGMTREGLAEGRALALGNGHAVIEYQAPWGRPVARWAPTLGEEARAEIEDLRRRLVEQYGQEKGLRIAEWNRNLLIYPNLIINDIMAVTVRTFYPLQPDFMEVTAWELAPEEESGARLARRLHNFLEFLGPGGFATPDDVEALDSCQIGFRSGGVQWSDISRGMDRQALPRDELQMRTFWRQWYAQMTGTPVSDWSDAPLGQAAKSG